MRAIALAVLLCPAIAGAEIRLDLEPIPELRSLEPAFHLDRGEDWEARTQSGVIGMLGLGGGRFDDRGEATAVGSLALGKRTNRAMVLASSELVVAGEHVWRGHHHGLVELRTPEGRNEGLGGSVALQTTIDHGEARGLAPVRLGQGRHDNADVGGEALIHLGKDKDDFVMVAELFGSAGATRWHDAPGLDRVTRRSLGLGIGFAPADGELPRGAIDLLRGRIEHASITPLAPGLVPRPARLVTRPIAAAGGAIGDTAVRIAELGVGAHELTLHIDHELLAVITGELGWSWIEADTAAGRIEDNMFRFKAGTGLKWRGERSNATRRFGIGLAREPGYTPDGQRIVTDWRTELAYGVEDERYVIAASGGISWIRSLAGSSPVAMQTRYGAHVEAFLKIHKGAELGGYHSSSYENQLAGDPFAAQRSWGTEQGVLLRWRSDKVKPYRRIGGCILRSPEPSPPLPDPLPTTNSAVDPDEDPPHARKPHARDFEPLDESLR